jgi:uncharacterized membrane protein YesL
MGKLFNLDSPFVQFMGRVADLMWLNILFIICCIPVITVGASITAMYYVTLKMVRNEESYITKGFFKSFKLNFRQATIIWLIMLLAGGLFAFDYAIMSGRMGIDVGGNNFATVMQVLLIAVSVFYIFTATFVFPILSKFDNSVKNTIKNAFIMSIRHFPATLACIAIGIVIALLIIYFPIMTMLSFFLLFSLAAYANSFIFVRVFDKYIPKEETVSDEEEKETVSADIDPQGDQRYE